MKIINPKLSIIIISYNVYEKVLRCINIIKKIINIEIIIIDNNSQDHTYKKLTNNSFSKNVRIFKNQNNVGFAKAVNMGIGISRGKYILLLNPDTIPKNKAIIKLLQFIENSKSSKIGLVGGMMLKHDGSVHRTYVNKPNFFTALFEFTNINKIIPNNCFSRMFYYMNEEIKSPKKVYGLSGGFLLFEKKLIKDIGLLDENFFMYLEDVDYGVRAREKGYKNYYIPGVKIIHESGSSSNSKYKINVSAWRKSKKYYFNKHLKYPLNKITSLVFSIDDFMIDIIHKIKKEPLI